MIIIKSLISYPIYTDIVRVQWEICHKENNNFSVQYNGDYRYNIELIGPDQQTVLEKSITLYNTNHYDFNLIQMMSYHVELYVKLTVTPPKEGILTQIVPMQHGLDPYEMNIAHEIIRKETLLFERKIGRRCKLFKRKYIGQPCTLCTDKDTGVILDSQCRACYGTRYGFFEPIEIWCDFVENPVEKQVTDIGTSENKVAQVRLTNVILVNKQDILYDLITNTHWVLITEPQIVRYRSYPISQIVNCSCLSPNSVMRGLK